LKFILPRGAQGVPGERGDRGLRGEVGPRGETSVGEIGPPGPRGERGFSGTDSQVPGPRGAEGKDGVPGIQGIRGERGESGLGEEEIRKIVRDTILTVLSDAGVMTEQAKKLVAVRAALRQAVNSASARNQGQIKSVLNEVDAIIR
jgi:Collagen triple helix repeat (20 copies)